MLPRCRARSRRAMVSFQFLTDSVPQGYCKIRVWTPAAREVGQIGRAVWCGLRPEACLEGLAVRGRRAIVARDQVQRLAPHVPDPGEGAARRASIQSMSALTKALPRSSTLTA